VFDSIWISLGKQIFFLPLRYLPVISRNKLRRHRQSLEDLRSRILRILPFTIKFRTIRFFSKGVFVDDAW